MKISDEKIIAALKAGKKIRRASWEKIEPSIIQDEYDGMLMETGSHPGAELFSFTFYAEDLTAEDWEIAK